MFEGQSPESVESLMRQNPEFRQMYYRHQELDKKAMDAALGVLPLDDGAVGEMKREKLALKSRLTDMFRKLSN